MEYFDICGGLPINGSVRLQGSKNGLLPVLAASVLAGGECIITNVPRISDLDVSIKILRSLGCKAEISGDTVSVDSAGADKCVISDELMREMRSSVVYLGALLARFGEAEISLPGGCKLGPRPIDMHLSALRKLGAEIDVDGGRICCRAPRLRGTDINFETVSVGATENAMIAACAAEGTTIITNAAREPEIPALQSFLNAIGGEVSGAGTNTIRIAGKKVFHGANHRVLPDRIAGLTVLSAAAACGGKVELRGCVPGDMEPVLSSLSEMGCGLELTKDSVTLFGGGALTACRPVKTAPFPGFPTDAQPVLMAACLKAKGTSVFVENIFEHRFAQIPEFKRMGAEIIASCNTAAVMGVERLSGASLASPDLRGGAALVIAALSAEGESRVYGLEHIDRGYEKMEEVFSSLGAKITRRKEE
jgi:UDP-N-acetylglucosamine 1-carboxyvinyltransferase